MFCHNTCFLCLEQNKNINSILLQDIDGIIIKEKLKYILSEFENFNPNITKNICIDCLKDVNFVYKFKQKLFKNLIELSNNYKKQTVRTERTQSDFNEYQMIPEYNTESKDVTINLKTEAQDIDENESKIEQENINEEVEMKEEYTGLHHEVFIKEEPLYHVETQSNLKDTIDIDLQNDTNNFAENSDESNHSFCSPPEIFETAQNATFSLLPAKSRSKYEKQNELFTEWCKVKKIKEYSEKVLLAYFTEKSNIMKSSSLWSIYSMLKSTLAVKNDIDISKYKKLTAFLKQKSVGYRPNKSKALTKDEINKFLTEAPDDDFLMMKVVLMLGVAGACRRDELVRLTIDDIEDKGSILIVKIPDMKTKVQRTFIVSSIDVLSIYRKYISLRPANLTTRRLFINYKRGKCSTQVVGMNTIGKIPLHIAQYLKLSDPNLFTGHCFRRTSATLLSNSGAFDSKTSFRLAFFNSCKTIC